MCCWSSSRPCSSSTAAVWEALWGSTPIITGMRAPFSRRAEEPGGQADFEHQQTSVEPLPVGCRQDRTTILEPTHAERQRRLWSDLPAPWNLRAAAPGLLPAFNKSVPLYVKAGFAGGCPGAGSAA